MMPIARCKEYRACISARLRVEAVGLVDSKSTEGVSGSDVTAILREA